LCFASDIRFAYSRPAAGADELHCDPEPVVIAMPAAYELVVFALEAGMRIVADAKPCSLALARGPAARWCGRRSRAPEASKSARAADAVRRR
jgi:hypothetical protein